MSHIFKLPDLGEGLPDAEIVEWHVKTGDEITVDQPLVSMETAKAVVDVPAPQTGRIKTLHGKPGDIIKTGSPLVEFENDENQDTGTVVGNIVVGEKSIVETAIVGSAGGSSKSNIRVTPAVRALAQRLQVDLAQVKATGPNAAITAEDVQRASQQTSSHTVNALPGFEPLRGVRRSMAITMAKAHAEIVPVTLMDDADIHAWTKETDITVRLIRALITACHTEPALNAWYDSKQNARQLFKDVNVGLAIDTTEGLFVPVIKKASELSAQALRDRINQFKEMVQKREIPSEELHGATISLSNFGNFAGRYANPIVVPPMVAILGTGKIRKEVMAINEKTEIHRAIPLSLTFDHRAVTGGEAARFLKAVIEDLEKEK